MSQRKSVTLNLTPVLAVWTLVCLVGAVVSHNTALVWFALVPWLAIWGLSLLLVVFTAVVMLFAYLGGHPITLTTPKKGSRVVQRKR